MGSQLGDLNAVVRVNPQTRQIAVVQPDGSFQIFARGEYKFNRNNGQVAVPGEGGTWTVYDGPMESKQIGGAARGAHRTDYYSKINGQKITPPPGAGDAFMGGVQQGASLGWEDELTGAANAIRAGVQGQPMGPAYTAGRDAERTARAEETVRHPIAAVSGNFVGGLPTAIATGGETVPGMLLSGAAQGATAGAGYSDAPTLAGVARDTALGTVTGTAAAGLGIGAQTGLNHVLASGRAYRALAPMMDDVNAAIQAGGRPAENSPILAAQLHSAAQAAPNEGALYIPDAWKALNEGYDRATTGIDALLTPQKSVDLVDRASDLAKNIGQEYEKRYAIGVANNRSGFLPSSLSDNKFVSDALDQAKNVADIQMATGKRTVPFDPTKLTVEDLHNVRIALDNKVTDLYNNGQNGVASAIKKNLMPAVNKTLYAVDPDFQALDDGYRGAQDVLRANEAGGKAATSSKPGEVAKEYNSYTDPTLQDAYKVGMASSLRDQAGLSASARTPEKLFQIPNIKQKLVAVGADPDYIDQLHDVAVGKAQFADAIISGSKTGRNQAFREATQSPLATVSGSDISGAALTGGAGAVAIPTRMIGRGDTIRTNAMLVRALANATPDELKALLKSAPQTVAAPYTTTIPSVAAVNLPHSIDVALDRMSGLPTYLGGDGSGTQP